MFGNERSTTWSSRRSPLLLLVLSGMRAIRIAREDVEKLIDRWHNREDLAVSTHR